MKTDEYFVKVKIESLADLPKDMLIRYFVMFKDGTYCKDKRLNLLDFVDMQVWKSFIDWYLLPVEQIELPSDEEIEKQADLKFDKWSNKAFWLGGAKWAVDWIKDKMK